ncbi:hypothetical protein [Amycolatopsis sp. NPDC059021]|uniref:hypothetical protein n=1 Tax=Amycolatopsis sp. NPDC059021 TaxID=3346704 RepID=UPI00366AE0ED
MNTRTRTAALSDEDLKHPHSLRAFRGLKLLVTGYLGLSVLTLVAIFLLRHDTEMVTDAVWVRVTIVVLSALLTFAFTRGVARGSRRSFLRLRIVSGVMVVAIAVIIAVPGLFPLWLRIEQGVCGVLLLGVVVIVNGKHLRAKFAK